MFNDGIGFRRGTSRNRQGQRFPNRGRFPRRQYQNVLGFSNSPSIPFQNNRTSNYFRNLSPSNSSNSRDSSPSIPHSGNRNNNFPTFKSLTYSAHDQENASKIFQSIMQVKDTIYDLLKNGELLELINGRTGLSREEVHKLISSFNIFRYNENMSQSIGDMFLVIMQSNFFIETLEPIVKDYFVKVPNKEELKVVVSFLQNCMDLLPSEFIEKMAVILPNVFFASSQFRDRDINSAATKLRQSLEKAKTKTEMKKSSLSKVSNATNEDHGEFRQLSVIPCASDIFCLNEEVKLRPNKCGSENEEMISKYESVDDYLDTQFRLLKEDFVRPLRDGIAEMRVNLLMQSKLNVKKLQIRIYENTTIEDMVASKSGLLYKVVFDVSKLRRVDWKKAKRFIYGSLLCFTNDFFETLYFASVVESDPKKLENGRLVVQFNDDPMMEFLENKQFIMIETKSLFEAYRHVLHKLQTFSLTTLPFKEYLVFGGNEKQIPSYMDRNDLKAIEKYSKFDKDLDDSQHEAFVNALQSSLSLIQGPPGTGKTYVGLKIINYLVSNFPQVCPILVVCYTNHALDQFLREIIDVIGIEKVVRVGGRSKLDIMKDCNMSTLKWKWVKKRAFPSGLYKQGIQNRKNMESASVNLIKKYSKIKKYNHKILSLRELGGCMNHNHMRYFYKNDFDTWIKGGDCTLENVSVKDSNVTQNAIEEVCNLLINYVVNEICYEEMQKDFQIMDDGVIVEDPDDILNDQRFLDGDEELLNYNYDYLVDDFDTVTFNEFDKDGFKFVANKKLIEGEIRRAKPMTEEESNALISLDIDFNDRLRLYKFWLEKHKIILYEEYKREKMEFDLLNKEKDEIFFEEYIEIMKSMSVIGMTTTGAARYGSVLDRVGCTVVIIEEAAEVLESHVVCSMSEYCQQLIMIGDHKQLRPKVEVYDLEINYNLGISLFERLIANKCQYFTLQYQHRMRPQISKCVQPIYPDLKDSPNVFQYPSVPGMRSDIYFFNHDNYENESIETSYKNDFEAEFVAKLCEHLIDNGNVPNNITVLTLYAGQLFNISGKMRNPMFKGIRICVVDNFQGEENEVIILSLVRSNCNDVVGFVNSPNRLCVAISRAKRGFYAIGNFNMIRRKVELLNTIISKKLTKEDIGNKLPLQCRMHTDEQNYVVRNLGDFSKLGCPATCNLELKCGHLCTLTCHRKNPSHKQYKCKMNCEKNCNRSLHKCKLYCYQNCKCEEMIMIKLPCNHEIEIPCFQVNIKCMEICEKKLVCGHVCLRMCHEQCKCEMKVVKKLQCGHDVEVVCGTNTSTMECIEVCYKVLKCGHECTKQCSKECKCTTMIDTTLPCLHEMKLICGTDISIVRCIEMVERTFVCGHSLKFNCFKKIDKCKKVIQRVLNCGHKVVSTCGDLGQDIPCTFKCEIQLNCGHICKGKCGDCYQGRLHKACEGICRKMLKCGHICNKLCHSGCCPPCTSPCKKYCEHSRCVLNCGEECDCKVCEEECKKIIKCVDCKMRKKCHQKCGESCSTSCKECYFKKYKDGEQFYIMKPCNCYVVKEDFRPLVTFVEKKVFLDCQVCYRHLQTPYGGNVLLYFKNEYSHLFHTLSNENILKWKNLLIELKKIKNFNINFDEMIVNIEVAKICEEDEDLFETSYKWYQDMITICKIEIKTDSDNLRKYYNDIQKSISHILEWINPLARNFEPEITEFLNLEKSKVNFSSQLLQFFNTISVRDYGLIHKDVFLLLEETKKVTSIAELDEIIGKAEDVKNHLKNEKQCTEEEEKLLERILKTNNIYKEFGLEKLSVVEKLKEIKNLIRRCHPDKNKSPKANEAVKKLYDIKKLLE